jgi:hypothetical protein
VKFCPECGWEEKPAELRNLDQNGRYWVRIVPAVAAHLGKLRGVPVTRGGAHYVLKCAFIGVEETALGPYPKSTKGLTVPQFAMFMDNIEGHFSAEGAYFAPWPPEAA